MDADGLTRDELYYIPACAARKSWGNAGATWIFAWTVTQTHTKNNERRVIPINETVATVLKALPGHLDCDALFPGLNGPMVTRSFWRAYRKAAVPNLRLHDLRYSFASYLAMGGFNLRTTQHLLGHKDLRMTSQYWHLSADHLQQAVKSLNTVLGDARQTSMKGSGRGG
jgi:integrase